MQIWCRDNVAAAYLVVPPAGGGSPGTGGIDTRRELRSQPVSGFTSNQGTDHSFSNSHRMRSTWMYRRSRSFSHGTDVLERKWEVAMAWLGLVVACPLKKHGRTALPSMLAEKA
jgi:hypothetical protein